MSPMTGRDIHCRAILRTLLHGESIGFTMLTLIAHISAQQRYSQMIQRPHPRHWLYAMIVLLLTVVYAPTATAQEPWTHLAGHGLICNCDSSDQRLQTWTPDPVTYATGWIGGGGACTDDSTCPYALTYPGQTYTASGSVSISYPSCKEIWVYIEQNEYSPICVDGQCNGSGSYMPHFVITSMLRSCP